MPHRTVPKEFDAYLRLSAASSMEWSAAFCRLSGCDAVQCIGERPGSPVGSLSALTLDKGAVCYFSACQTFSLTNMVCRASALLLVREGEVTLSKSGVCLKPGQAFCLPAGHGGDMQVRSGSRVMIVKWFACPDTTCCEHPCQITNPGINRAIDDFLQRSRFFRHHDHALECGEAFLNALERVLASPVEANTPDVPFLTDNRIRRAVERIETDRQWRFNLAELAAWAGVSERNLYYLMKQQTGLTPYRYYQRCRLLRVRLRLVDCQCEEPHISWYAADEGFSHLGRFAGIYREHFGELPSETVQWRTSLTESVRAEYAENSPV